MTKDLISVNKNNTQSILSFEWMIIDKCQQKCSYCSSVDFNNHSLKNYDLYKIGLYKLGTLKQPFKIDIVGGEPMLHKNIHQVVEELTKMNNCKVIDICSNMRSSVEDYLIFNQKKLHITASFHIEYQKDFKEKCLLLTSAGIDIEININMYPELKHWVTIKELIHYCKFNKIKYSFNLLNKTSSYDPKYDNDFFEFFSSEFQDDKKYIEHQFKDELIVMSETDLFKNQISYQGMNCRPMQFQIELNGDIINDCTKQKVLTLDLNNIVHEIKCPLELCHNQIKYRYEKTI